jgi:hypothetical protein
MLKFATIEYMQEVKNRTNADERYLSLSKGENVSYTMVIDPEPEKGATERRVIGYETKDGVITEVWEGEKPTQMVIGAPYGVWVSILLGKTSVTRAFLTRKLKLKGNLAQILKMSKSTDRWLEILATIPTAFAGEYEKDSIRGAG